MNLFYSGENDPFFIKGNEQMIGRSLIYLDPINHLLPISSKTPIIDYNGFSRFRPEAITLNLVSITSTSLTQTVILIRLAKFLIHANSL